MGSIDRRLRRLEEQYGGAGLPYPRDNDPARLEHYAEELERAGWSIEDQFDEVLVCFWVHRWGGTRQHATDRQLLILEEIIAEGELPELAREYFQRMPPADQPKHEARLFAMREGIAARAARLGERLHGEESGHVTKLVQDAPGWPPPEERGA